VKARDRQSGEWVAVESDAVLIAVGRNPVIQQEMFNRLGVQYDAKGICVDEYLRTTVPGVWAIGAATGKSSVAHVGIQQGLVCAENIMKVSEDQMREMDYEVIPAVVYSIPEIVSVGHVSANLEGVGVYKVPFAVNLRAKIENYTDGFIKVWIKDNRVLAAQAIGHGVSEIMQELANMIALRTPVDAVAEIIHAHPTYSEIVRSILEYSRGQATDFILDESAVVAQYA